MTVVNDTGSTLSHLECTWCGQTYDADQLYNTCPACGKVLYARYRLPAGRAYPDQRSFGGARTDHVALP